MIVIENTLHILYFFFFFFNDTATTEIYTLSLHDALPICRGLRAERPRLSAQAGARPAARGRAEESCGDRKSTRLNSSHSQISYAVFCLKKKKYKSISSRCPCTNSILICYRSL